MKSSGLYSPQINTISRMPQQAPRSAHSGRYNTLYDLPIATEGYGQTSKHCSLMLNLFICYVQILAAIAITFQRGFFFEKG